MSVVVRREVRLLRRVGTASPGLCHWSCQVQSTKDRLDVCITAPRELPDHDLDAHGSLLHSRLLERMPPMLQASARSEVGVVLTETEIPGRSTRRNVQEYALAACSDALVVLADHLSPVPDPHWRHTCTMSEVDQDLPVVLGPSAVLSLAAGALEMADASPMAEETTATLPGWVSACSTPDSPYPLHGAPPDFTDLPDDRRTAIAYWIARTEHWMRPMQTTRSSRGQYRLSATLPVWPSGPALWVEALTSLDTQGRYWLAALSVGEADNRRWLTRAWRIEARAVELLEAAVSQAEQPSPALDRDPIDGESFGWAPAVQIRTTAGMLAHWRCPR